MQATIGVVIAKDWLDTHRLPEGIARRFPNSASGHRALIAWIGEAPVDRVAFEATGACHRALERALAKAGVAKVKVNPLQAGRFAEAIGQRAKTDPVDAAMLARMVALLDPALRQPTSEALHQIRELHGARHALVKDRTAAHNRQKNLTLDLLKRQAAQRLEQIDAQLEAVDRETRRRINADEALARRFTILCSIPGIGETTAFARLIDMPELGTLEPKQAASLAGLAPLARQSGTWKGRASFAAAAPSCAKRCSCRRSSPSASTPTSPTSIDASSEPASHPNSPSSPSCASSCRSPMPCSAAIEPGPRNSLDHHGYSSRLRKKGVVEALLSWVNGPDRLGRRAGMRGGDARTESLFSYVSCEARVPAGHPLRPIRAIVDAALAALSPEFGRLYSRSGRPSIPPEKLLRALLLQAFYSVRPARQLMEQLDDNLLFRPSASC